MTGDGGDGCHNGGEGDGDHCCSWRWIRWWSRMDRGRDEEGERGSGELNYFDVVKTAVKAAGPVYVLVCNHGVFFPQELDEQDTHEMKLTVNVNLMGTFHVIKAALPSMKLNLMGTFHVLHGWLDGRVWICGIFSFKVWAPRIG
ncbi:hypothetical protein Droror1_Dr00027733 [Drosera rotundifolia]